MVQKIDFKDIDPAKIANFCSEESITNARYFETKYLNNFPDEAIIDINLIKVGFYCYIHGVALTLSKKLAEIKYSEDNLLDSEIFEKSKKYYEEIIGHLEALRDD